MAILMVLLALGPFLHAHYGSSRMLGFHVDGVVQAGGVSNHFETSTLSQDTEEESAAVGVTASHARQSLQEIEDETSADFVVMALVLFAATCLCFVVPWRELPRDWLSPSTYALGFPPPAHAPPTLHI